MFTLFRANDLTSSVKGHECKSNVLCRQIVFGLLWEQGFSYFHKGTLMLIYTFIQGPRDWLRWPCAQGHLASLSTIWCIKSRMNVLVFSYKLFVIISKVTYFCICCHKFEFLNVCICWKFESKFCKLWL